MSSLEDRLSGLERAARLLEPHVPEASVLRAAQVVAHAGERLGLGTELTVVALAGSTGSGKSSLFNALSGLELARAGVLRPTTDQPLACVWGDHDAAPLLDWLDVPSRRRHTWASPLDDRPHDLDGLVLLDLPDHDSMVASHREQVDRLVARADMLVWVTDPVKYADALLHEAYLSRLSRHGSVVVVVLNRLDRLEPGEATACLTDLRRLLARDELTGVPVLATSARTGAGVQDLAAHLRRAVASRQAAADRLAGDVALAADELRHAAGLRPSRAHRLAADPSIGGPDADALADGVARAWGVPAVARAAADEPATPPPTDPARADALLGGYLDQVTDTLPDRWRAQVRDQLRLTRAECLTAWSDEADRLRRRADPDESSVYRRLRWLALAVGLVGLVAGVAWVVTSASGEPLPPAVGIAGLLLVLLALVAGAALTARARAVAAERRRATEHDVGARLAAMIGEDVATRLVGPATAHVRRRDAAVEALEQAAGAG